VPRSDWVDRQLRRRGIRDERVLAAMERVPRELFVPAELQASAYHDEALPIGAGQTVSQPYIVAFICQGLALDGGERVLDVGTGSGYQAAVLAELAGEVHSIERIPELAERARGALAAAGYDSVTVHVGDGTLGLAEHAPYDGIAVAAAAPEVPAALWDELRGGGRMVIPLAGRHVQDLVVLERGPRGAAVLDRVSARFVPLLGEHAFREPG
jgi:protein-L-isoaspartate(D-aspartate) O-methyltransferase